MLRSRHLLAVALFSACTLPGCATIIQGRHQELTINSNPPGATFEVDGVSGVTPGTVALRRKQDGHLVSINKPGYEPAEVLIGRQVNAWTAANIIWGLLGMPIGVGVDFYSGAAYKLDTENLQVALQPLREPTSQAIQSSHQTPAVVPQSQ